MLSHIVKYCFLRSQCEMKFAHIRVSEYFTGQISLKKAHIVLVDKCVLFSGSAPTRVACRELSPALARLCSLALWLLRFEKTIVNRFFLLALAGPRRSSSNSVIHIKKTRQTRGLSIFKVRIAIIDIKNELK